MKEQDEERFMTFLTATSEMLKQSEESALALVKKLEEADRNKDQFLSTLSHELRNPLAAISAELDMLDISQDKWQIKRAKDTMHRQINQLCALVDELLDLTRITNNKIDLKKKEIELNELIKIIAEDQRTLFSEKDIMLHTGISNDPIYLDADPVRLKQIISNLLSNAYKHTRPGGETILSGYKNDQEAVISVKDNGTGICPQLIPRLFQPFVQAGMPLDRSCEGLGLGLSITKGIAELHGGSVEAHSEGLGKGSEFMIRLPLSETGIHKRYDKTKQKEGGMHKLKILIIEDNRDFVNLLSAMLDSEGYQVKASYDGHEGVETCRRFRPDIVFCDIGLPGMNGFEVAKIIKGDDDLKNTYLAALTGYAGESDLKRTKESGFDRHISKPANFDKIRHLIEEYREAIKA